MKAIILSVVIIFTLLAVPVMAQDFEISVGPYGEVFAEDTLKVEININNKAATEELFLISQPLAAPPANKWASMDTGAISIPAYSNGTITVSITPTEDAKPGDYRYEFTVKKDKTGEIVSKEFQITVRQRETAAGVKLELSCESCTGTVGVTADVDNYGTSKLKDTTVMISVADEKIELPAGEINISGKKQLTTEIDIGTWRPGEYSMSAELVANGQSLDIETVSFTVAMIENIFIEENVETTLWSKSVIITAENLGNAPDEAEIKAQVQQSLIVSISYSEPPTARGDEWVWTKSLEPGESYEVTYTEFYWPIPIVIVLAILGAAYLYLYSTSIGMKKTVTKKGEEWSVGVAIKNRGAAVEGVVVRDIVPLNFTLGGKFETLKPIARKTDVGTELIWRVGGIKRGEEKVLHYRIKPKGAAAGMRLSSARLRAKKGDKTILASSNVISLPGEKQAPKLKVEME